MATRTTNRLEWLKSINQWLPLLISVIGATVSGVTFYFVYMSEGQLDVLFPDKVAIASRQEKLDLVVPLTFTNTGSTRSRRQVHKIMADVFLPATQREPQRIFTTRWQYEVKLMHRLDYFKNYPDERSSDNGEEDFVVYNDRALPFQLNGGAFVSKTYDFVQTTKNAQAPTIEEFQLTIRIQTERGEIARSATYRLAESKLDQSYSWAERAD